MPTPQHPNKPTVVAIISQKGGSGKTTLALHLAVAARQDGQAVLIVDLDPQASATHWRRARVDQSLVVQPTHPAGLADLLRVAGEQGTNWVIIDTAAQTETAAAEAVEVADLVLVTCRPSVMDLRAIPNSIRLCRIREKVPHVVLTQIEPQGTLADEARQTMADMGVLVLPGGLGRRAAYHHSLIDGRTATETEPKGKAAQEVRELFGRIKTLVGKPTSRRSNKKASRLTDNGGTVS